MIADDVGKGNAAEPLGQVIWSTSREHEARLLSCEPRQEPMGLRTEHGALGVRDEGGQCPVEIEGQQRAAANALPQGCATVCPERPNHAGVDSSDASRSRCASSDCATLPCSRSRAASSIILPAHR